MCGQRSNYFVLVLLLVLYCAVLLPFGLAQEQNQNSSLTLAQLNGLWKQGLDLTQTLPQDFDQYQENLKNQINLLQSNNQLLTDNNNLLIDKNLSLSKSSFQLMEQVTTLEQKSEQLQKYIDDSIVYITKAQDDAKKLILQNKLLKYGGIIIICIAGYETGKLLKIY